MKCREEDFEVILALFINGSRIIRSIDFSFVQIMFMHPQRKATLDYIGDATYELDILSNRSEVRPNLYQLSKMGPTV